MPETDCISRWTVASSSSPSRRAVSSARCIQAYTHRRVELDVGKERLGARTNPDPSTGNPHAPCSSRLDRHLSAVEVLEALLAKLSSAGPKKPSPGCRRSELDESNAIHAWSVSGYSRNLTTFARHATSDRERRNVPSSPRLLPRRTRHHRWSTPAVITAFDPIHTSAPMR